MLFFINMNFSYALLKSILVDIITLLFFKQIWLLSLSLHSLKGLVSLAFLFTAKYQWFVRVIYHATVEYGVFHIFWHSAGFIWVIVIGKGIIITMQANMAWILMWQIIVY